MMSKWNSRESQTAASDRNFGVITQQSCQVLLARESIMKCAAASRYLDVLGSLRYYSVIKWLSFNVYIPATPPTLIPGHDVLLLSSIRVNSLLPVIYRIDPAVEKWHSSRAGSD